MRVHGAVLRVMRHAVLQELLEFSRERVLRVEEGGRKEGRKEKNLWVYGGQQCCPLHRPRPCDFTKAWGLTPPQSPTEANRY